MCNGIHFDHSIELLYSIVTRFKIEPTILQATQDISTAIIPAGLIMNSQDVDVVVK